MKRPTRFGEWLFRFASSQKNVDCFIKWVGRVALVLGTITAILLLVVIFLK